MKWTPEKRAETVALRRGICQQIAEGGPPYHAKVEAAARRLNRQGLSKGSIRKIFDRWIKCGRLDYALEPYFGRIADKKRLLAKHHLTPEKIGLWFKATGTTMKAWATARGLQFSTVARAIRGERVGDKSEEIMDRLAAEIHNFYGCAEDAEKLSA